MSETEKAEDAVLGKWVYCGQHLKPHRSGWCSVGIEDKVGLGPLSGNAREQEGAAEAKCRRLGLKIYDPTKY